MQPEPWVVTSGIAPYGVTAVLSFCSRRVVDVPATVDISYSQNCGDPCEKKGEREKSNWLFWVLAEHTVICVVTDMWVLDFKFPDGAVLAAGHPGSRGRVGL